MTSTVGNLMEVNILNEDKVSYANRINKNLPAKVKKIIFEEQINKKTGITRIQLTIANAIQQKIEVETISRLQFLLYSLKLKKLDNASCLFVTRILPYPVFSNYIYLVHDTISYKYLSYIKSRIARNLQARLLANSQKNWFISQTTRDAVNFAHGPTSGITVLNNDFPSHEKVRCIVWVGSKKKHKRLDEVITVAHNLPQYQFVLICPKLKIELPKNCTVLSGVNDEVLSWILRSADRLLCTSEEEGFYLPALQALRQGTKVILPDISIFREIYGKTSDVEYFSSTEQLREIINALDL